MNGNRSCSSEYNRILSYVFTATAMESLARIRLSICREEEETVFDDENVMEVEEATVKQFGGDSRQSAYMLVYIQKKYALQILREIPSGLCDELNADAYMEEQQRDKNKQWIAKEKRVIMGRFGCK
eukprot:730751_1